MYEKDKFQVVLKNWDHAKGFLVTEIKYVHQLQNLYFAITEKELELSSVESAQNKFPTAWKDGHELF